jgi:DNA invertase Pin-like site-specific DNA recombinase
MPSKAAVAVYLRVSTADQSHDSQRAEVLAWLERQAIDPARVVWYVDTETGRVSSRPELDRLKTDVETGRVKTVVVYKLDRLSRDMLHGMELVGAWCKAGVRVASVTQPIDLSGTVGRVIAAVLFGFAELEWTTRKDRQAAGIAVAKSRGVYKGAKPGYRKAKPARAEELRARGLTVPEIATTMGVSVRTVARYLATT